MAGFSPGRGKNELSVPFILESEMKRKGVEIDFQLESQSHFDCNISKCYTYIQEMLEKPISNSIRVLYLFLSKPNGECLQKVSLDINYLQTCFYLVLHL